MPPGTVRTPQRPDMRVDAPSLSHKGSSWPPRHRPSKEGRHYPARPATKSSHRTCPRPRRTRRPRLHSPVMAPARDGCHVFMITIAMRTALLPPPLLLSRLALLLSLLLLLLLLLTLLLLLLLTIALVFAPLTTAAADAATAAPRGRGACWEAARSASTSCPVWREGQT